MINIELPYSEVKDKQIDFHINWTLMKAWLMILDKDDNLIKMWQFTFEEV
jgi:hypothetical protein